jgi:hypothetical protein
VIQATGQKIIVYVSILSVMAQSWLAYRFRSAQRGQNDLVLDGQLSH